MVLLSTAHVYPLALKLEMDIGFFIRLLTELLTELVVVLLM